MFRGTGHLWKDEEEDGHEDGRGRRSHSHLQNDYDKGVLEDDDDTLESRRVVTLKASPHPGMKIGVLKNQRPMRMTKRTRT